MGSSESKKDPQPPIPTLGQPWRHTEWNNAASRVQKMLDYKPHDLIPKTNLLLVGACGAGKSSFFNTTDSICKGRISIRQDAMSHNNKQGSITTKFSIRTPGFKRDNVVKFNVCDTVGLGDLHGLLMANLAFILDGNVPDGFQFGCKTLITPASKGFINNPTWEEKMHCVAYVVNATKFHLNRSKITKGIEELRDLAKNREIRVVILVTHIDKACHEVKSNLQNVYSSVALRNLFDAISDHTGFPLSLIFPVKNYCDEVELNDDVNILHLTALQKMLDYADDVLDDVDQQ